MAPLVGVLVLLGSLACGGQSSRQSGAAAPTAREANGPEDAADAIFLGRHVYTMRNESETVEGVAVKEGRIVALGTGAEVDALRGPHTMVVDLGDAALLPGFFDAHGHFVEYGAQLHAVRLLSPPLGEVRSIADIEARLHDRAASRAPSTEWIVGVGYDDAFLAENRHPTRGELDAATGDRPTVIMHVSGHFAVANSAALAKVGWTRATRDPPGGTIYRDRRGEPNGLAGESAILPLLAQLPTPSLDTQLSFLREGEARYLAAGYTTAHDGATSQAGLDLLREADRRGMLRVDVVAFPLRLANEPLPAEPLAAESATYGTGHDRVEGYKIVLDGSPQGRTAFLTHPYLTPPTGERRGYRGHANFSQAEIDRWVESAFAANVQFQAHCNGDAAADQLLDAVRRARASHPESLLRPVMVHAQTVRDDQLDAMKDLDVFPSFFPAHVYVWGDYHRDVVLGLERASRISPTGSALARGIRFSAHNDAPVTPPDAMLLVYAMVTRRTSSGRVLGADQTISRYQALRAVTIDAAYQHHEDADKGTLEVGKRADFVVLAADPFAIDDEALRTLPVLMTVTRGEVVYRRP